jgi:hypothetical protein
VHCFILLSIQDNEHRLQLQRLHSRIKVEKDKSSKERGYYLNPELFNESSDKNIRWVRYPDQKKRLQKIKDMKKKVKKVKMKKREKVEM